MRVAQFDRQLHGFFQAHSLPISLGCGDQSRSAGAAPKGAAAPPAPPGIQAALGALGLNCTASATRHMGPLGQCQDSTHSLFVGRLTYGSPCTRIADGSCCCRNLCACHGREVNAPSGSWSKLKLPAQNTVALKACTCRHTVNEARRRLPAARAGRTAVLEQRADGTNGWLLRAGGACGRGASRRLNRRRRPPGAPAASEKNNHIIYSAPAVVCMPLPASRRTRNCI